MKKAYVKPVFVADEYELTAAVMGCDVKSYQEKEIWNTYDLCSGDSGHQVGGSGNSGNAPVNAWWEYATETPGATGHAPSENHQYNDNAYIFSTGNTVCDFVWNSVDTKVGVWVDANDNAISDHTQREGAGVKLLDYFAQFFLGAKFSHYEATYQNEGVLFSR